MKEMQNFEQVQKAAKVVAQALNLELVTQEANSNYKPPLVGIILGTGLNLGTDFINEKSISFAEIPEMFQPTVASHAGNFILANYRQNDKVIKVLIQQGRCHLYEGASPADICLGVRIMAQLGIKTLIITNASGAINTQFDAGSIMCITDQINFTGQSPLLGPNVASFGLRFPDMSQIFDKDLQNLALKVASEAKIRLERGVYLGLHGPELESPAETRAYRILGADAVGFSTVLEVIAAKHLGMKILGLTCLTNKNLPDCMQPTSLEAILSVANSCQNLLNTLISGLITQLE